MKLDQIWLKNILISLNHIADRDYQSRSWFGVGPEVSSPSEVYNELFDDCRINEFIDLYRGSFPKILIEEISNLIDAMEAIDFDDSRASEHFWSSGWEEVRKIARRAADALGEEFRSH